jgi:hypothetical protein
MATNVVRFARADLRRVHLETRIDHLRLLGSQSRADDVQRLCGERAFQRQCDLSFWDGQREILLRAHKAVQDEVVLEQVAAIGGRHHWDPGDFDDAIADDAGMRAHRVLINVRDEDLEKEDGLCIEKRYFVVVGLDVDAQRSSRIGDKQAGKVAIAGHSIIAPGQVVRFALKDRPFHRYRELEAKVGL